MTFLPTCPVCYIVFMLNQRVEEWEMKLDDLLKRVDQTLEDLYGSQLARHPARPSRGSTSNPQHDGLFRVTARFTPGFGSELGKGYELRFDMVTLETLPEKQAGLIQQKAVQLIQDGLEEVLPGRGLRVKRDGNIWKIVGDLSLSVKRN